VRRIWSPGSSTLGSPRRREEPSSIETQLPRLPRGELISVEGLTIELLVLTELLALVNGGDGSILSLVNGGDGGLKGGDSGLLSREIGRDGDLLSRENDGDDGDLLSRESDREGGLLSSVNGGDGDLLSRP
jgi:hypothetical protein